jgi:pyruvate, orthophosphate dikinase
MMTRPTRVQARANGAEGIGLTRTEHMFFKTDGRIKAVRKMILSRNVSEREASLMAIEAFQREDFEGIFKAMDGLPVTIRLLDPPLHEFLPSHNDVAAISELSNDVSMSEEELKRQIKSMKEVNPMLGFRGCRLGIAYPEITRAQVCFTR